jgi:hypothetical protein
VPRRRAERRHRARRARLLGPDGTRPARPQRPTRIPGRVSAASPRRLCPAPSVPVPSGHRAPGGDQLRETGARGEPRVGARPEIDGRGAPRAELGSGRDWRAAPDPASHHAPTRPSRRAAQIPARHPTRIARVGAMNAARRAKPRTRQGAPTARRVSAWDARLRVPAPPDRPPRDLARMARVARDARRALDEKRPRRGRRSHGDPARDRSPCANAALARGTRGRARAACGSWNCCA